MKEINNGKQMRNVWEIPCVKRSEKNFGNFPTQKPLNLLERIILACTDENYSILDPFNGSGTTGIATKLNRKYIGIDVEQEYLDLTLKRYKEIKEIINLQKSLISTSNAFAIWQITASEKLLLQFFASILLNNSR